MGLALSLLGPSVSYLEQRLDVSTGVIGVLFALTAMGNFAGALIGGRWINRWGGHMALRVGIVTFTFGSVLLSIGETFAVVSVGVLLIGAATGVADTAMNIMVVWARVGRAGPSLNSLHLMFGVGALLAPLVVDRSLAWSAELWPACLGVMTLAIVSLSILGSREAPAKPADDSSGHRPELSPKTIAVVAIFFMLYVGGEVGFAGWIHTYAEDMGFDGSRPALVTAVFWGSFSLGRLIAIPVSGRIRSLTLVMSSCSVSVVALGFMVLGDTRMWTIWLGTAIYGLAAGPQYPTMIAMVDDKLSLSPSATSWIVAAAAVGALLVPTLIGPLIDASGSPAMPRVVLIVCAIAAAWVMVVQKTINGSSAPDHISALRPL